MQTQLLPKTFYPTPGPLIDRMIKKIKGEIGTVLEPSAGKGAIIDRMKGYYEDDEDSRRRYNIYDRTDFSAIEIDEEFQAILRSKGRTKVIDNDFLTYSGPDKFDLIIGNPPFDNGDAHLMKAIDIMYRGQIIFLLNAETIRNPFTNARKALAAKLNELKAEIEFIPGAFVDAERPTGVEVALVNIEVKRAVEEDLFAGAKDKAEKVKAHVDQNYEVATKRTIADMVADYNNVIKIGTETIISYYKNYNKIGGYIGLNREVDKYWVKHNDMTDLMQNTLNSLLVTVRTAFWRKTLDIAEVRNNMTTSKQREFEHQLQHRCDMDFTEYNVRTFILNLINGYEEMLIKAVVEIFDKMTIRHCYSSGVCDENIHYFNGWKTNKAFKVNKRVIIPVYGGYKNGPFVNDYDGKWAMNYNVPDYTRDIDMVMHYFDGNRGYLSIAESLKYWLEKQQSKNIHSSYFTITVYKKGTMHLEFNDPDILRRFNIAACRGKAWLPYDYGTKPYGECSQEVKDVIDEFDGEETYMEKLGQPLFAQKDFLLQIEA